MKRMIKITLILLLVGMAVVAAVPFFKEKEAEKKSENGFEEIFVGMLILERVYNDKEKSKTNTEYIFMVFTYCSTGKCFCTAVLQEAR